ncbi:unnamed protein product [Arctia plantaginis]|uniref:Uncharacterized protein n=1 Tax=Arctia plantaginis TaxID=874455 RepID=A0A8S1AY91_ARCPL|nr:unnamed protein product [Arctia plantaginis]
MKTSSSQFELMVTFMEQSSNATGGGPARFTKLTDLKQKVLKITSVQAGTGLAVEKAGVNNTHLDSVEHIVSTPHPHQFIEG